MTKGPSSLAVIMSKYMSHGIYFPKLSRFMVGSCVKIKNGGLREIFAPVHTPKQKR